MQRRATSTVSRDSLFRDWLGHCRQDSSLPQSFTALVRDLRHFTASRDHPDVQRTFPLVTSSDYGAWFEGQPIDIVPRLPTVEASPHLVSHVERLAEQADILNDIEKCFHLLVGRDDFTALDETDRRHSLWLAFILAVSDDRPWLRDKLYHSMAEYADPDVRALIVGLAYVDLPWPPAESAIYHATHDTDEVVFLPAFRICGRRHDERAMDHLLGIVGHPAAVLDALANDRMQYPVGHAACSICPGQFAILGTDDPALAEKRESHLRTRVRQPLAPRIEHARERLYAAIDAFVHPEPASAPPDDLDVMVLIPAGPFQMGIDFGDVPAPQFDWSTCMPARMVDIGEFHIDRFPVTNAQYDDFVDQLATMPAGERRIFEHPGQKPGKPHRRNTRGDERFGSDHPVVGIDWFDAWAYARWRGKQLPTESQWEKAARGETGALYPWGNRFDQRCLRSAGATYGNEPRTLRDWVILLSNGTHAFPPTTTAPVHAHPEGASPYGVEDMCGNAWEFTRTSFSTREDVRAAFADFDPVQLMGTREGHVVIRGGAWSSPASLVGAAYRGYDLLTDRHTEIGFRCVWETQRS